MSKVTLSPLITDVRNRMGNIVFSKWKKTNYARQYSGHSRGSSENQLEIREAFSIAVTVWKNTGNALHRTWEAYAENLNMSGYNAFIKANVPRILENTGMELFKSTGMNEPMSLSAGANPGSGEIICNFTAQREHIIFFVQGIVNGRVVGAVSLHETVNAVSPFIITGLEPGAEYFVYAAVADADYANATEISAAADMRTTAGA